MSKRKPKAREVSLEVLDAMPAPSAPSKVIKEMSLEELKSAAKGMHGLPEVMERVSGVSSVLNGLIFSEIKSRMAHGEWLPWLRECCGKSVRSAQLCMRLGDRFSGQMRNVSHLPELSLALIESVESRELDFAHPLVREVESWTQGRGLRTLIKDECPAPASPGAPPPEPPTAEQELAERQQRVMAPFFDIDHMGDAWMLCNDAQLDDAIGAMRTWVATAEEYLRLPKKKRPLPKALQRAVEGVAK